GQNLGHTCSRTNQGLEVLSRPAELLATRLDRIRRRKCFDREGPPLVSVHQRRESIEFTLLSRARLGIPKLFDTSKRLLVCRWIYNGVNHGSDLVRVDAVVLGVCSHEANEHEE